MGISKSLADSLKDNGFIKPSPIQKAALPIAIQGKDMIIQAKSGTGKTLVFIISVMHQIKFYEKSLQAIVLAPTREIAQQTHSIFKRIGQTFETFHCALFIGGITLRQDLDELKKLPQVVVGTPGRLKYLIETNRLDCSAVKMFILDEADMLFGGQGTVVLFDSSTKQLNEKLITKGKNTFPEIINWIWWTLPKNKQTLALSATYPEDLIRYHLMRYLNKPKSIRLDASDPALIGVSQYVQVIGSLVENSSSRAVYAEKVKFLKKILSTVSFQQCLIFSNFHAIAEELCSILKKDSWPVAYLSGALNQNSRLEAFEDLQKFKCRILVSTDLVARGVDAENIDLVINMEIPWDHETYLHRVGRAGRFGSFGACITIVCKACPSEMKDLDRLNTKLGKKICLLPIPLDRNLTKLPPSKNSHSEPILMEDIEISQEEVDTFLNNKARDYDHYQKKHDGGESLTKALSEKSIKTIHEYMTSAGSRLVSKFPDHLLETAREYLYNEYPIDEEMKITQDTTTSTFPKKFSKPRPTYNQVDSDDPLIPKPLSKKQILIIEEYKRLAKWAEYYYEQYQYYNNLIQDYERLDV